MLKDLDKLVKGKIFYNEPMQKHTSYGIGGPAEVFVNPADSEDLRNIIGYSKINSIPICYIGSGSNLLVSDEGIKGIVISPKKSFKKLDFNGNTINAESGVMLGSLVKKSTGRNLTGLESLVGVPGTLGGALVMNAGAFGSEISNFLKKVSLITSNGDIINRNANQINFAYRHSNFSQKEFILSATFELKTELPEIINQKKQAASKGRKTNQPLKYRSAGSIFKNPDSKFAAGYLIEKVGLKGHRVGNAQISDHHANFFINHGNAKAEDVIELIKIAKEKVLNQFNINLELEVKLIGFSHMEYFKNEKN
jgi:UDP-N-acetylmuramate dehydrogenase